MFFCNTERRICHSLPYPEILFFIAVCAWLGYFGMLLGLLAVLTHLSHLTSFGIPYLMPFVGADLNNYEDERDFIWRRPLNCANVRFMQIRKSGQS